jgi:DNA polymerase IV
VASRPPALCRDCLTHDPGDRSRCRNCGSPRIVRHAELGELAIAHIDCDAFYAAIEKRDNPDLADKPVIIGGGRRGVVSTACYIARTRGVRSAMPMFKALQACPNAVVLRPDIEKYARVGKTIREMMLELTPGVEPLSIDEAFLDLTGTQKLHKAAAAEVLARFALRVEAELRLTVSVGLSYCKFLAKIASDFDKPRGYRVIGRAEAVSFLAAQPVSVIWGVGKVAQAKLASDGIEKIDTLQQMEESELIRRYGSIGQRLFRLARGVDSRGVDTGGEAKSISAETTFERDIASRSALAAELRRLSEKVASRLKKKGLAGQTIVLKLKTGDFRTRTRNHSLADPTQLADQIYRTGLTLLTREADGTFFRLIGIGVTSLGSDENADPHDLVDWEAGKRASAERAMDKVRGKFGEDALRLVQTFRPKSRRS